MSIDDDGSSGTGVNWSTTFLSQREQRDELAAADDSRRELFSVFIEDHLQQAVEIAAEMSALAVDDPSLASVQQRAEELEPTLPEGLVQHALMMFITHDPAGRAMGIPSLEARKPDAVAPSRPGIDLAAATDREALLDWWREDPKASEHHEHWHVVFPGGGVRRPGQAPQLKDRHGELFYYMHRQMLARYNAERLAVAESGMTVEQAKVQPLADYRQPLEGGYNPGFPLNTTFGRRPEGLVLRDVPLGSRVYTVDEHELVRDRLLAAAQSGTFEDGTAVTSDRLGNTAENTIGSVDPQHYGGHHNMGHVLVAALGEASGVMISTESAIRDPIFWRWHRHVDDIWWEFQQRQSPQDFADPGAVIAHPPVLVFEDQVDIADPNQWASQVFGPNFGAVDVSTSPATDELETAMFTRIVPSSRSEHGLVIAYLDQRPFGYVLQLENPASTPIDVTARIFLAPDDDLDDPRAWIEMDKFKLSVDPGQNSVYRAASESSVVKKPATKPPVVTIDPAGDPDDLQDYCTCGWPYNLLLPRGTRDGSGYQLMVLYTDAAVDDVIDDRQCGSVSFCGVVDNDYPDTRPMGYPFDRPFPGPIVDTLAGIESAATAPLTIRWIDPWGADASAAVAIG